MGFEKHLFISYAHIDDRPLTGQSQGWISRFHRDLEDRLAMRLGYDAKIWRDERLSGNDIFSQEIVDQFPKTAILVSVLSPRYVKSDWCKKEVDEFCRAAQQSGGLTVENKSRVIKIVKTPVSMEDLPPIMKEMLGYDFFVYDGPKTALELDPAYGPDMLPLFNRKMAGLAADLAELIEKLETGPAGTATADAGPARPPVYLAECGYDRGPDREALETDLRAHGYTVLPDRQLPAREDQYLRDAAAMLERCCLAVHLVGSDYGAVPYGPSGKSVAILQNELAIQRCRTASLPRILWLPAGTASENPLQQRFLNALQQDAETQYGADLIVDGLEALKANIHAVLRKLEQPKKQAAPVDAGAGAPKLVYLICDERDKEALKPLRRHLAARGFQVRLPLFDDDAASVRQHHQEMLTECEAAIHFYGFGDVHWKTAVESDLRKMRAYRGDRPPAKLVTYIAPPDTPDKQDMLEFPEAGYLNGIDGLPEAALHQLLQP